MLFGASGYTGGRVAAAMVARGLRPVLMGRDDAKLAALAERLGGLDTTYADVADRTSLMEQIRADDVLVSTVGPFHKLGWVAIRAAVDAGATYLDSAGEPPFIRSVYEWFGPEAEGTARRCSPRSATDYVPGVLAGALALRDAGAAAERVDVGYFGTGRGRSAVPRHPALAGGDRVRTRPRVPARRPARRARGHAEAHLRRRRQAAAGAERRGERAVRPAAPRAAAAGGGRLPGAGLGVVRATSADHVAGRTGSAPPAPRPGSWPTTRPARARRPRRGGAGRGDRARRGRGLRRRGHRCWPARGCGRRSRTRSPPSCWPGAAGRAAEHGVAGVGALDAVAAFGLDEVEKGAAEAGIVVEG